MSDVQNEPAFPVESAADHQFCGMTLRDYFAAGFAQAQATATSADSSLIKPEYIWPGSGLMNQKTVAQIIAENSYALADAMLAARNA